jgi:hypothetical protein
MNELDTDRTEAERQVATILAAAYLRLRFPSPSPQEVDCPETKSEPVIYVSEYEYERFSQISPI